MQIDPSLLANLALTVVFLSRTYSTSRPAVQTFASLAHNHYLSYTLCVRLSQTHILYTLSISRRGDVS